MRYTFEIENGFDMASKLGYQPAQPMSNSASTATCIEMLRLPWTAWRKRWPTLTEADLAAYLKALQTWIHYELSSHSKQSNAPSPSPPSIHPQIWLTQDPDAPTSDWILLAQRPVIPSHGFTWLGRLRSKTAQWLTEKGKSIS